MLTPNEKEELEQLRKSAAKFMTDPLDKAFFHLESLIENQRPNRIDSVLPTSHFYALAKALIELKNEVLKNGRYKENMR